MCYIYLNLITLWIAGPSTLNVQSVKVTESGLVKENVASHGWFNCGWELSWKNKSSTVKLIGRAYRRVCSAVEGYGGEGWQCEKSYIGRIVWDNIFCFNFNKIKIFTSFPVESSFQADIVADVFVRICVSVEEGEVNQLNIYILYFYIFIYFFNSYKVT